MHLQLKTTGGAVITGTRYTLVNGESPTSARIDIRTDSHFYEQIRLYASTMSLTRYITLTFRVCGMETLSLTSSAAKFYIHGYVAGNPGSMSESTRYIVITESTFQSWFSVNLGQCDIDAYSIHATVSPLANFPDS